jgi:4a-hydroxytetrahydrobiopterin dehydratase
MNDKVLVGVERARALHQLSGWGEAKGRDAITKIFQFKSFSQAWGWMNRVALYAEKADHHPEWLNVYGRVEVTLATHTAGGLTEKDVALARKMDEYAGS